MGFTGTVDCAAANDWTEAFFALMDEGADFIEDEPGAVNIITDGNLITGQNFQSAKNFAK